MVKEKDFNFDFIYWIIGFICGFVVCLFTMNHSLAVSDPLSTSNSSVDIADYMEKLSNLECPSPDPNWGVSSDRYLVFMDFEENKWRMHVWFMSDKGSFDFADRDPSKTLRVGDLYGKCYTLDSNFEIIEGLDYYDPVRGCFRPEQLIPDKYNADRLSIVFIYSTQRISTYYIEGENREDNFFIKPDFHTSYWRFMEIVDGLDPYYPAISTEPEDPDVPDSSFKIRLLDILNDIYNEIKIIPTKILDGIKEIFSSLLVPDTSSVQTNIDDLKKSIFDSIGFDVDELENTFKNMNGEQLSDVEVDMEIGGKIQKVKILDTRYLVIGVEYIRPYIRGFIMLMLFFFVLNQISHIIHIEGFTNNKGGDK